MQTAAVLYDGDGGRMSKESLSRKKVCFTDTLNSTSSHPRRPWQARLDTHKLSLTAASFSSFKMNCSKSQTMRIFSCKRKREPTVYLPWAHWCIVAHIKILSSKNGHICFTYIPLIKVFKLRLALIISCEKNFDKFKWNSRIFYNFTSLTIDIECLQLMAWRNKLFKYGCFLKSTLIY